MKPSLLSWCIATAIALSSALGSFAQDKGLYCLGLAGWSDDSVDVCAATLVKATTEGETIHVAVAPFLTTNGIGNFHPMDRLTRSLLKAGRKIEYEIYFSFYQSQSTPGAADYNQGDPGTLDAPTFKRRAASFVQYVQTFDKDVSYQNDVRYRFSPSLEAASHFSRSELLALMSAAFSQMPKNIAARTRGVTLSTRDSHQVADPFRHTFQFQGHTSTLTIVYCVHGTPPEGNSNPTVRYSNDGTHVYYSNSKTATSGGIVRENGTQLGDNYVSMGQMLTAAENDTTYLFLESFNLIPFYDTPGAGKPIRTWVQRDRAVFPIWKRVDDTKVKVLNGTTNGRTEAFGTYEAELTLRFYK